MTSTPGVTSRLDAAAHRLGLDVTPHNGPYPLDTTLPWANDPEYLRRLKSVNDCWDFGLSIYLTEHAALNAEFKRRYAGEDLCAG